MIYVLVGIGGAIGALLRYKMGAWVGGMHAMLFPYPTLVINLLGCFLLALLYTLTTKSFRVHPHFRTSFGTGLIGSFTTFSTFSEENAALLREGHYLLAGLYIIVSLLGGYGFALMGVSIGSYERSKWREGEQG